MKPVTLPPGREKLATKPLPTGSVTLTKMMGMVRVCCSNAAVLGVLCERMRSGCSATSSFANCCHRLRVAGAAQRVSIRMLRPSVQPSFWSPRGTRRCGPVLPGRSRRKPISTPIRRMRSPCCARAAIGHAAAAPPSSVMNSRRPITRSPRRRVTKLPPASTGSILPSRCYFSFSQVSMLTLVLPSVWNGNGGVVSVIRSPSRSTVRTCFVPVQYSFQEMSIECSTVIPSNLYVPLR